MNLERKHITLGSIGAGLVLVGGLVAGSVDWAIKTSDRIGDNSTKSAQRDSLFDARLSKVEKKLGLKSKPLKIKVEQEGVFKRIARLFW